MQTATQVTLSTARNRMNAARDSFAAAKRLLGTLNSAVVFYAGTFAEKTTRAQRSAAMGALNKARAALTRAMVLVHQMLAMRGAA